MFKLFRTTRSPICVLNFELKVVWRFLIWLKNGFLTFWVNLAVIVVVCVIIKFVREIYFWLIDWIKIEDSDDAEIVSSRGRLEDFQYKFLQVPARLVKKGGSSQMVISVVPVIESPMIKSANGSQEREDSVIRVKWLVWICALSKIW